ncbi:hypothetical protein INR49_026309 [Caranx melampygus]|nr:hypothetical protein INR49_026309 [Caranx melampygus]
MGMATLLNAPLHSSQQDKVTFDRREDFGEKTVMFTTDEAFMDMTHKADVSMDMTEAQTGRILGFTNEDDPFQCLLPPQGMYAQSDIRVSQTTEMMKTKHQQSSETPGYSEPKGVAPLKNPSLRVSHPKHNVNSNTRDECREKTIMFSVDDDFMDMTQSHTVNIAHGPLAPRQMSTDGLDTGFKGFLSSLSKPNGHTVAETMVPPTAGSFKAAINTNGPLSQLKTPRADDKFDTEDDYREKTVRFSADDACMDVTQSHTVNIATDVKLQLPPNLDFSPYKEKTLRFNANDAAMDMTECLTVNIDRNLASDSVCPVKKQESEKFGPLRDRSSSALSLDQGFNNVRTGLSKPSDLSTAPVIARMTPEAASSSNIRDSSNCVQICPEDDVKFDAEDDCRERTVRFSAEDAAMDVTQSHTVNIATHFVPRTHPTLDPLPACGEKTVRFTADNACMDVTRSYTVNIASHLGPQGHQNMDFLPTCGEKTVRFSANDAAMDVTRSHTVNIASISELKSHQNPDPLPKCGEKTVRFNANDAAMDMTQSHTVNIASISELKSHQNADLLPPCGERTVRFSANDAAMDVTRSHTVNIASASELKSHQNADPLPSCGEKTLRFNANDAAMDVTRSHTVNIASNMGFGSEQNLDFLPTCVEKTAPVSAGDTAKDMRRSRTVNIASHLGQQPHQNVDFISACGEKTARFNSNDGAMDMTQCLTVNIASNSEADSVLPCRWKHSQSKMSDPWTNPVITKTVTPAATYPTESVNKNGYLDQLQMQKPDMYTEKAAPAFVPDTAETPQYEAMTDCAINNVSMDMTEAQTGHILEQPCTEEVAPCHSSTQDTYTKSDQLKQTELTSQLSSEALGSSSPNGVEITNYPDSSESNEIATWRQAEPQKMESPPSGIYQDPDLLRSRKSRRISLADIQSKVRRLSHMINTAPDTVAIESCLALAQSDNDLDKNPKEEAKALPVEEPEPAEGLVNSQDNTQAQYLTQEEEEVASSATTTPFNLKTKQLMSRLSVGGFKPKLPQRSKPDDPKKTSSVGEHTKTITVNITDQMSNFDNDVSDIYDEELGSYEDMSETLDTRSPQRVTEKASHSQESGMDEVLEKGVSEEDLMSAVHGKKRPLASDDSNMEDEKRMKTSTEKTTDFGEMKLDDGTITVLEFFKLFNIDFVIHNPRQSVLPGRLLSDTDRTPMDLLKDRHISRPKQMVYETNVQNLTEKVEGLKVRMQDLDKPLKIVNGPLWEEMRYSSEKELKSFGAKLKERNNFFRKMSKAQSHEMKEDLYSNLVQANLGEQQKLRGTIEQADEMIKSLDDCISELEAELAAVEENGSEDKPSLKSQQEEMKKVTEALADSERQISELERKQNLNKLKKVKAETRNLESHVTILHMLNEWKFVEEEDNCTAYTFLHNTMHLQLVYEKCKGKDADKQSERKICHINFNLQMDAAPRRRPGGGSLSSAGEELRLLKMWGGLRLDILNISCVDTQVHIAFSSLKKRSKFEVVFSVGLINHLCVLQVKSFKNFIGSSEIKQIEEIVASFSPAKNLLTKIVKKIHDNLLR